MYYGLTSAFLLLDGIFHVMATEKTLEKLGPDREWARFFRQRGLFDVLGFNVTVHRAIGVFLIVSSILSLIVIYRRKSGKPVAPVLDGYVNFYHYVVTPIALVIIGGSVVLKAIGASKKPPPSVQAYTPP